MIRKETQNDTEDLTHRRKGGAFDDFARIMRKVNKLVFNTGTTLNDRPGVREAGGKTTANVNSESVFEIFQKEPKKNSFNFITIGKKGTGENFNTNYIDISVNSRSDETSPANGNVAFRLTRDGNKDTYKYSKIALYEAGNYTGLAGNGVRAEITGEGAGGGVQLGYVDENGAFLSYFVLDADGLQIYPLIGYDQLDPEVKPSHQIKYAGKITWSSGTATNTVTVTGVLSTDIVMATIQSAPTESAYLVSARPSTNIITFKLSASNTSNDAIISYQVIRAVT